MLYVDLSSIDGVKVTYPPELERTNRILTAPDINEAAKDVTVGHCTFAPFSKSDLHTHHGMEVIYVISGSGKSQIGDKEIDLLPDRLVVVPAGVEHDFRNIGDSELKLLFIFSPPEKAEDLYLRALKAAKEISE